MVGPFTEIQSQINYFFPPETHPYRALERAIDAAVGSDSVVLDVGCGHGAPNLQRLKGRAGRLYGIDLVDFDAQSDDMVLLNESISDLKSFADNSIDLAYSRSVMEHVADIENAYKELYRVLRPGGIYVFLTPNRYDYASIIATLVPNRFHAKVVKLTEGRDEQDTFPIVYASNTFREIRRLSAANGFRIRRLERLGQYPSYLRFSRPLFWLGCLYEKALDKVPFLDALKGWIFCTIEKPPLSSGS